MRALEDAGSERELRCAEAGAGDPIEELARRRHRASAHDSDRGLEHPDDELARGIVARDRVVGALETRGSLTRVRKCCERGSGVRMDRRNALPHAGALERGDGAVEERDRGLRIATLESGRALAIQIDRLMPALTGLALAADELGDVDGEHVDRRPRGPREDFAREATRDLARVVTDEAPEAEDLLLPDHVPVLDVNGERFAEMCQAVSSAALERAQDPERDVCVGNAARASLLAMCSERGRERGFGLVGSPERSERPAEAPRRLRARDVVARARSERERTPELGFRAVDAPLLEGDARLRDERAGKQPFVPRPLRGLGPRGAELEAELEEAAEQEEIGEREDDPRRCLGRARLHALEGGEELGQELREGVERTNRPLTVGT